MRFLKMVLTVSLAPVAARHPNESQKASRHAEGNRGQAVHNHRADEDPSATADHVHRADHDRARDDRASRRCRVQPAVAVRADAEDVLRVDRQQRGG